jgi:hypothetical protein
VKGPSGRLGAFDDSYWGTPSCAIPGACPRKAWPGWSMTHLPQNDIQNPTLRWLRLYFASGVTARYRVVTFDPLGRLGCWQGAVYPDGPWRPSFGVQRGSVQFLSLCAGDPVRADGDHSVEEVSP